MGEIIACEAVPKSKKLLCSKVRIIIFISSADLSAGRHILFRLHQAEISRLIIACEAVPKSKKLLCSKVRIGSQVKQIVSGIKACYTPEEMVGKKVMVLVNLKPATLAGVGRPHTVPDYNIGQPGIKRLGSFFQPVHIPDKNRGRILFGCRSPVRICIYRQRISDLI